MTSTTTIQDTQSARTAARAARFWEIDALRGVAIITMIVYHLMWDLWYWQVLPNVVLWEGFWKYWQRFTAGSFLILVGVSMTIVYRRQREKLGPDAKLYPKFFWRGLRIFGLGMIITLVVTVAGVGYVDFGILHLIGFATMVAYPLLPYKWVNLGLWVAFSLIGRELQNIRSDGWYVPHFGWGGIEWWGAPIRLDFPGRWLAPLGIMPTNYPAVDYFPIIPWLGVVLLGVFLGNVLYADNKRRFPLPYWGGFFPFNALEFLGRHSLLIYMVHQPLLLLVLYLLGVVRL